MSCTMLAFWTPGPMEMVVIAAVGLIVFGNRLPEVGRSLGKGIVEFKKGLKGVKEEMDQVDTEAARKKQAENPNDPAQSDKGYNKEG